MLRGILPPLTLVLLSSVTLPAQHNPEPVGPVLKSTSRLVIVDVVVRDANGQPVPGLRKEDFRVLEDGVPQVVSVFEEHTGRPYAELKQPALPPNTFSNTPRADAPDSLNVVLLDALNTPLTDQVFVRQQILKYLNSLHTSEPIAVFILSERLRMVHGFTRDLPELLAALGDKASKSGPQLSPLLRSGGEIQAQEQTAAQIQSEVYLSSGSYYHVSKDIQAEVDALRQFSDEQESSKTRNRVDITLSAMRQIATYLAGFPGRKNVVWFSGAFPLTFSPNPSALSTNLMEWNYAEELRKTARALTVARVAVYPVEAGGLSTDPLFEASGLPAAGITDARTATEYETSTLQEDGMQRTAAQTTMKELAFNTGGEAFYNTNGLDDALAQAIHHGARYYTLDYTPTNKKMYGRCRHIHVQLTHQHYKLAYRPGYDPADEATARTGVHSRASGDPLRPLMAPGLPNFPQILYEMRVKPTSPQPEFTAQRAGDNSNLQGAFTRMDVDLAISEKALRLEAAPNGQRNGTVELALVVYDRYGNPLNWVVRNMELSLTPEQYKNFWDVGVQFHMEFDVPRGASYLRSGVCDLASGKAGTIEVVLDVPAAETEGKPKPPEPGPSSNLPTDP
ncbi:MAG TPA: VWA domain-containing protein [Verrucomicrobiae bacterium]|nr:VWA domain-containing protein [Verrucomicrobiae bacterium]